MIDQPIPSQPIQNKEAFAALLELDEKERTMKTRQGYRMAYVWSILFPPIGVYYFFKYLLFSDGTKDSLKAGVTSLILTIISLLVSFWLVGFLLRQTTSAFPSNQSGFLKELITPANQKDLKELYQ